MNDKVPPPADKNLSESLMLGENLESCIKFGDFVERTPFVKAILRHIATIPVCEKRHQFVSKFQLESIMSQSANYPLETIWYMDTVLPNSKPSAEEVLIHQDGYLDFRMTLFSYINKDTGLLARYRFALLVDRDYKSEDFDRTTSYFEEVIMTYGGYASVKSFPEVRWDCINVVIGTPRPRWRKYSVKLYSINLLTDAINTLKFDFKTICQYRIVMPPSVALNICNLSQLI